MISCIVLAGGKSERMGRDKRFLRIGRKQFLEKALETASKLSDDVILSLAAQEPLELRKFKKVKLAYDEVPHKGPLGGLISSFKLCVHEYAAVMPCDSPLLKQEVFSRMAEMAQGYDAVVPRKGAQLEPLHAVYKVKPMLAACESAMANGSHEVSGAVAKLEKVRYVPVEEFKALDEGLLTFFNVNYPEDLTEMGELVRHEKR